MDNLTPKKENTISLEQAFNGQGDALTEISSIIEDMTRCIAKLTDEQIALRQRVEVLERTKE